MCSPLKAFDALPLDELYKIIDEIKALPVETPARVQHPDLLVPPAAPLPPWVSTPKRRSVGQKPRQVRREHREKLFLQHQAKELEITLKILMSRSQRHPKYSTDSPDAVNALALVTKTAMWKQLAKRQLQQRAESEMENTRLKAEIRHFVQVANNLETSALQKKRGVPRKKILLWAPDLIVSEIEGSKCVQVKPISDNSELHGLDSSVAPDIVDTAKLNVHETQSCPSAPNDESLQNDESISAKPTCQEIREQQAQMLAVVKKVLVTGVINDVRNYAIGHDSE